jgi:hypothetical protein
MVACDLRVAPSRVNALMATDTIDIGPDRALFLPGGLLDRCDDAKSHSISEPIDEPRLNQNKCIDNNQSFTDAFLASQGRSPRVPQR